MSPAEQPAPARIGYVLKMYPRFSETFIVNELLALEAAGTDIDVFSLRPPVDGRFHETLAHVRAGVTYLGGYPKSVDLWAALSGARPDLPLLSDCLDELLDAEPGDAVQAVLLAVAVRHRGITHLHAHFASVATTVARLASRLTGVPYSFTAHAKDIFHESVDPHDLRRKLSDASGTVTVSNFNHRHLRDTYGPAAAGVTRIYNGLDLTRFPYSSPLHRRPTVAAVGRLVEKKGFADLVDAVALLVQSGRDVAVELVGTGPLEDELREQVVSRGLSGHVHLRGALPQQLVRRIVQEAAALAAPCIVGGDGNRDGLPTVLLEGMALGTPCVGTPVTGIPEVVRDDVTGFLVPGRSPHALADALDRLLTDGALRVRLAEEARLLMEREFDVHRQATQLRVLFGAAAVAVARDDGAGRAAAVHRTGTGTQTGTQAGTQTGTTVGVA